MTTTIDKKPAFYAVDVEQAVLGALLSDSSRAHEAIEILTAVCFYKTEHQIVFQAILDLNLKNEAVDIITVSKNLSEKGKLKLVGGDYYLVQLSKKVTTSAHIEFHARIVLQYFIKRALRDSSNGTLYDCQKDNVDVFELLDNSYNRLNAVTDLIVSDRTTPFSEIINEVITKGIKLYNKEIKAGIPTPILKLTQKTGGWRNSELIIIAARPGMGKTAFALSVALTAIKHNIPTAFFSLEMSKTQLTSRIISMETEIPNEKFVVHGLSPNDVKRAKTVQGKLNNAPLFIDDTSSFSIERLQIKIKALKRKEHIKFVIVDYLQLMTSATSKNGNREQEISKISRGLKGIAKDLNIPVIALSQLSRSVENRSDKRPVISDLRESGAIEQDADMVMFLYRPEYYGIEQWGDDYRHGKTEGEAEYNVAKNRNGQPVRNRMRFRSELTLFGDLEEAPKDHAPKDFSEPVKPLPF